jgi:hypothetical protein
MLMGTHDCCVNHDELVVGVARQNLKNPCEYATFTPPPVPTMHSFPVSVAFGKVTPWHACAIAIEDGINE